MKHVLAGLSFLALVPASSALAGLSCVSDEATLSLKDSDPQNVQIDLLWNRNLDGWIGHAETLNQVGGAGVVSTYALTSTVSGQPAKLTVVTKLPAFMSLKCGRVCPPDYPNFPGENPKPIESPKISAKLEIGTQRALTYDFSSCTKLEN